MRKQTTIASLIFTRRSALGHTLSRAAAACGVTGAMVGRWEFGASIPRRSHVPAIARYLGITESKAMEMRDADAARDPRPIPSSSR